MKIKLAKEHKDIMFWALLISGIGFCIGGIFVQVLIPVGMVLLGGAIGVAKDAASEPVQNIPSDFVLPQEPPIQSILDDNSEADVSLHFDFSRHQHHPKFNFPSEKEIKEHIESETIAHKVSKRLH